MSGPISRYPADQRVTTKGDVTDQVENLVADELIVRPQFSIHHAALAQNDGIVETASADQSLLEQIFNFAIKTEGSSESDLLDRKSVV